MPTQTDPNPPTRPFSIRDGMLLIAAAAVGTVKFHETARLISPGPDPDGDRFFVLSAFLFGPGLIAVTAALLVARLLPPRPARVDLSRQPGFAAAWVALALTAARFAWVRASGWSRLHFDAWWLDAEWLVTIQEASLGILVAWASLAMAGSLRAERSWIDRALRAVAVLWLLAGLGSRAAIMIRNVWEA